jgi:hypothetical protein
MKLSTYDEALQRETEAHPERADAIAAERERIAPALALELEHDRRMTGIPDGAPAPEDYGDVDALVTAALAHDDEAGA